jgi:hypothetical protein
MLGATDTEWPPASEAHAIYSTYLFDFKSHHFGEGHKSLDHVQCVTVLSYSFQSWCSHRRA